MTEWQCCQCYVMLDTTGNTNTAGRPPCQHSLLNTPPVSLIYHLSFLCAINRLYADHFSPGSHTSNVTVLNDFSFDLFYEWGQERLERYLFVSCLSCLYSFTTVKYKQTKHFIDIRSIQEDPITLSIYVIAARDELNLNFSTLLTIQLSSSSLISSTSRSHFR